ncbi:MAG: FAD-dependent oxidoreductase [Solirubrobacteraceae bacterium]
MIGGGTASAHAARALVQQGADRGSIVLIGREPDAPYRRPPITKSYLAGLERREQTLICPPDWWEQAGVEVLTRTSVMDLDTEARTAKLSTKETFEWGSALIATGAIVRRLQADGAQLEGIHYLRALGNADALLSDVEAAEHVVMIGGSYIGCEVAATLTALGKACTVVMQEQLPLERGFGAQAGGYFKDLLEGRGVRVLGGRDVAAFEGGGRVQAVRTAGGERIPADVVVCGVGALPDVMLARKSGLELGSTGGVLCDSRLRTSAPGLFAAGDMCEYDSVLHGRRLRVEHEDAAAEQGRTAALNMLGGDVAHRAVPYFFSDLADWASLEYIGPASNWDREVVRGSIEDGSFSIFYLNGGRLAGALSVGRPAGDLELGRELLTRGTALSEAEQGALVEP